MNTDKEFVKLIDKRNELIKNGYGAFSSWEEESWIDIQLFRINNKIVSLAKQIVPNENIHTIQDVFANEFLVNKYLAIKTTNISEIQK